MGASYHSASARGNVRPRLEFVSLDAVQEPLHELVEEGDLVRVWVAQAQEALEVRWTAHEGFRLSHRGDSRRTRLNGLPIGESRPVSCGDILRLEDRHYRIDIEGEQPSGTLEQASWTLVEKVLSGGLIVRGGDRGALELELHAGSPRTVRDLERCPLAFEVKSLDVVVVCAPDEWTGWQAAIGSLAGRTEFVLPRLDKSFPTPQRLAPLVELTLDGEPLSVEVPVCLVEEGGRLVPTHLAVPGSPRIYRDGAAVVFDGRKALGLLEFRMESCVLGPVPSQFVRVLMPGDVWHLVTAAGTQVLRVQHATRRALQAPRSELPGFSFRGVTFHHFVRQPVDSLEPVETFREVIPGRFVSDFGNEHTGEVPLFELAAENVSWARHRPPRLVLPAVSPFFAGAVELPAGGVDESGLRVFVDALHETADGAALAFEAFVAAPSTAERAGAFLRLLRARSSRDELAAWASRAFSSGAALPSELEAPGVEDARALLWALARNEPIFGAVTRLIVQQELDALREPLLRVVTERQQQLELWLDLGQGARRQLWPASLKRLNGFWPDELARPLVRSLGGKRRR